MKHFLISLFFCLTIVYAKAQYLSAEQFMELIPSLEKEDWKSVFEQSSKLLKSAPNDTSEFHARIIYINIFAAAGMVSEKKMTYPAITKLLNTYIGQKLIMAYHPYSNEAPLGHTSLKSNDTINEAFTSACNNQGTSIFCFEKCAITDKINLSEFKENELIQCSGILTNVETNPNKSTIWVVRLYIDKASITKDIE
ncbi:MAG: hypothetical protein WCP57_06795 [Bacteroidota bacterium]